MTGGDFSAEAYEQLRQAYAKDTNTQLQAETEGVKVGGQEMTLETLPVDSPWKSKIENWEYPTGRSTYLDGKQDPAEILAIMRGAAQEQDDAEKLEEAKELVAEAEAEEAEAEDEEKAEEPVAEAEEAEEADEAEEEISDEDFSKLIQDILEEDGDGTELEMDGVADDEVEGDEEGEEETEEPVAEAETEEVKEEDEEYDPQAVADEISRLKAELENMRFVPTAEQPEANDESD